MTKLKVGEDSYIEEQSEILQVQNIFYESLYRSTEVNPQNFENSPFLIRKILPH